MPVSATFLADFSQFVAATKSAELALKKVEVGGAGVGRSLTALEGGAGTAAGKVAKFNLSVGQADALLGRFGLNLPPAARGLADLASMSEKAGGGLGLLGKASLVAGAAFAGWKVGEWIGEVSGLTDKIADGTAKLLGWGDVAGQEAAAGQDVLARATKIAGREITNQVEAMRINQEEAERKIAKNHQLIASEHELAAAAAETARVYESNREKTRKLEFDMIVAGEQRKADEANTYGEMGSKSANDLKAAQVTSANFRDMETQFENERLRAHQEADIAANAQQMQTRANAAARADAERDARRTGQLFGGAPGFTYDVPATEAAAPVQSAARSSSGGYGTPRARGATMAAPITVNISGVFDPTTSQTISNVIGREQTKRLTLARRW